MKVFMTKDALGWHGSTPADQEQFDSLRDGDYSVEITQPRNIQFHRKFFALVNAAASMQEKHKDRKAFLDELKILAGHYDVRIMEIPEIGRTYVYIPRSISFAKMDDTAFEKFYSRVVDVLIENFCPGTTPEEIDRVAMEYVRYT